jgi:TonB family protein
LLLCLAQPARTQTVPTAPAAPAPADPNALIPPVLIEDAPAELPEGRVVREGSAVMLEILIDAAGAVTEATVIEAPDPELGAVAAAAARRSRFQPAQRAGQPIVARIRYRYVFRAPPAPEPAPAQVSPPEAPPAAEPVLPAPAEPSALPADDDEDESFGATATTEAPAREVTRRPIKAERVAQLAGANNDPLRAIELLPGVARPPLNEPVVLIRGSGPDHSVVMLDSTPVLLLYHLGGFKSFVNAALLERVDFYPGNFSVRYGRAIGGAVDAHLRTPRRDGVHGVADISLLDASLMIEGPVSDDISVAVAGRRSYIDVLLPTTDELVAAPVYWDYQALASYRASPNDELYLQGFGSSDSLELLFKQPNDEFPDLRGTLAAETQFHRAMLGWRHKYGGGFTHDIKAGIGYIMLDAEIGAILTQRARAPDFNARADWHAPVAPWLTFDYGLDFTGFSGDLEYDGPAFRNTDTANVPDSVDTSIERHVDLFRPAGYLELTVRPIDRLALIPGVRVDYFGDIDRVTVDPRFSTRYGITEQTTVKAGIGRFSQPPPLGSAIPGLGNPDLLALQAIHLSAGAEQEIGAELTVDLEGYYKWLSDLVVNTEGNVPPHIVSEGEGRVYGLELNAQLEMSELFAQLSYSLSRSERRQRDGSYVLFDYDQPHILTAAAGYRLGRGWVVSSTFRLVSGNPETPILAAVYLADEDTWLPIFGRTNSARAALFHRLDLRIEKRWTSENGNITIYLDVQNVMNQRHPEATVYSFDYRQKDEVLGLPILPILGVRGEL